MKYNFLLCGIFVLLLFSCKKENKKDVAPVDEKKLYPISFKLSGFTQSQAPLEVGKKTSGLTTQAADDSVALSQLIFILLDAEGKNIRTSEVKAGTTGFGSFNQKLAADKYTAIFYGATGRDMSIASPREDDPMTKPPFVDKWAEFDIDYDFEDAIMDVFFKKIELNISPADTTYNIHLDRLTGQLVLNIKDTIPANKDVYGVGVSYTRSYAINLYTGQFRERSGESTSIRFPLEAFGKPNFRTIIGNTFSDVPFTVTIRYAAKPGTTYYNVVKTINNVTCIPNTKTILSGNLFSDNSPVSVNKPLNMSTSYQHFK